jgi:hypothetical protein
MGLVDPHTGMPINPPRQLTDEQIVQIVQALQMKIHLLNQQNMQLGLYVEFIVENLSRMVDENGEQLFNVNVEEWPEWAEARYKEVQEAAQAAATEEVAQEARQTIEALTSGADEIGIDLSEETPLTDG